MASSSVEGQKAAQQPDHVQTAATQKANKSHQSCRERVKEMRNKMFHHDQSANQTACAERKKKEANCMPKMRARMNIIRKKKNKEGDTSSSSSDEGDQAGKATRNKN